MKRGLLLPLALTIGCAAKPDPVVPPAPDPPAPPPSFVAPVGEVAKVTPDADFRKEAPPAGAPIAFVPPKIEEAKLKNGVRVLLVTRNDLPLVAVRIVAVGGGGDAPPGIAGFANALLLSGTKTRSAVEISDALGGMGAQFGVFADDDGSGMFLNVLSDKLGDALAIAGESLAGPTFPADELERERKRRLTSLAQVRDSAGRQLWAETLKVLYPSGHPYALPMLGTEAAVTRAKAAELAAFHARTFTPDHVTVSVVGDVKREALLPLLERTLGALKGHGGKARAPVAPPPASDKAAKIVIVDRKGATQTNLQVALPGVPRSTPDFDALLVMNTIFGSGFSSRLNMNLREKHAYTYGARSGFDFRRGPGPFIAGGAIVREATAKATKEIFSEVDRIRQELVTDDELAFAKSSIIDKLPSLFETNGDTASALASLSLYGLPLDEYEKRAARIKAITKEEVLRVAKKYLDPKAMRVVMVGDHEKISAEVTALGLGKVELAAEPPKPKP